MTKQPATPPVIPGFTPIRHLGSGGFADVFLYEQENPKAEVAVKVLSDATSVGGREAFRAEADIMASVSHHPYIVKVSQAGIAEDGRPYFVMDYYSGLNFSDRARTEEIPIPEVLKIGVQLASAVETAHRAGILHRDIKPANVLTDRYGIPGLADFGIASPAGQTSISEGMSVPFAPPEALGGSLLPDARYDVYSLAATVYTLLAGRSPFEIKGGDNSQFAMMERVERSPVPPTGRVGVPPSLENVLRVAMTKDRDRRTATAADFGRALNQVESDLQLGQTHLVLEGQTVADRVRTDDVDEDGTRIKGVKQIDAQDEPGQSLIDGVGGVPTGANVSGGWGRNSDVQSGAPSEGTAVRGDLRPVVEETPTPVELASSEQDTRSPLLAVGAAAAVIVLAVIAAVVLGGGGSDDGDDPDDLDEFEVIEPDDVETEVILPPAAVEFVDVVDNGDGTFTATWTAPEPDLRYIVTPDGAAPAAPTTETSAVVETACVVVEAMGTSGQIGDGKRGCAS